jgi:hypothetical protein
MGVVVLVRRDFRVGFGGGSERVTRGCDVYGRFSEDICFQTLPANPKIIDYFPTALAAGVGGRVTCETTQCKFLTGFRAFGGGTTLFN